MRQQVDESVRVDKLSDELRDIYSRLQIKFNQAGITNTVGERIATILSDDKTVGRFLSANSNLSVDELMELYKALGSPSAKTLDLDTKISS